MLWVKGNVTTESIIPNLFLPSLISVIIPTFIVSRMIKGEATRPILITRDANASQNLETAKYITKNERKTIFFLGLGSLVFVPIYRAITNLPPFIGILLGLGILWIYTEILYLRRSEIPDHDKARIPVILARIDISTMLFFLGILMAVAALECSGILNSFAIFLQNTIGNIYIINILIGFLSSIVDNVPLVAGAMGMYPMANDAIVAAASDPSYMLNFVQNGNFWLFLAYCAGVGGSILIIGSAAGVVTMGLEKIDFLWYFKKVTWIAAVGYLAGAAFFILQQLLI
jgi:Na+/H+ antiporter NhaD/arsenite permease-like protein